MWCDFSIYDRDILELVFLFWHVNFPELTLKNDA